MDFFSLQTNQDFKLSNKIFNQSHVTFVDFEDWDEERIDFGLRLLILNEEHLDTVHPVFVSPEFHTKKIQVNLLVIPNVDDSAHFALVLNLNGFLKTVKLYKSSIIPHKRTFFCQFCLCKNSNNHSVISMHEKFCLNNPVSNPINTARNMIKFEEQKTFLKCSNRGRDPPNWIGFLDFETKASGFNPTNDTCKKHPKESCICSFHVQGKALESISYSLIIADFRTNELLLEIFYIPKNDMELSAAEHSVLTLKNWPNPSKSSMKLTIQYK